MLKIIKSEFNKAFKVKRVILFILIIFAPFIIQFLMIKDGYTFYFPIEVFEESFSGIIPLLFPIFSIIIYSDNYYKERKNNFISTVYTRTFFNKYIVAKGVVNFCITFLVLFVSIIIPFIFLTYIEPLLGLIEYTAVTNKTILPTRNTLAVISEKSHILYAIIYSFWVAINGAFYATFAFLLTIFSTNYFTAMTTPIIFYHLGNFLLPTLSLEIFSPLISVFPFSIQQQPLWILFIPFLILFLINLLIGIYIKKLFKNGDYNV